MEFGDPPTEQRDQRSVLDVALDAFDTALTDVIEKVEAGGLEQLDAAAKVALWHRVETFRNRLPMVDHALIADAEATDLAGTYCFSSLTRFLVRVLQLSAGEAASRSAPQQPWDPAGRCWGRCCSRCCAAGCVATRRCRVD